VDFFELIYLTMFLSVSLIGLIMPVINGSYIGWDIIRYNIYSLYLGIFSFAYLTYKVVEVYRIPHSYLSVFTGILFSILLVVAAQEVRKSRIRSGLSEVVDYYPARVAQIDSLSRAYHLKNGIASYWDAKYITMFSRENLRLVTVYSDLKPWYHVMNQNWYCFEDQSHETPRRFTFLVQGDIRNDCIEKCLGSPIKTISCSGEKQILIFRPFSFDRKKEEIFYPGD
jgi:hypothetical protein